ncbi:hypothetical protein LINPERHAP2_LOCUS28977, partial [Linum perenne]
MCPYTAEDMTWHATETRTDDGMGRHPRDADAWKNFSAKYPDFAADPRNPLIEELQTLWIGVEAYDSVKKETFTLRAALIW